MILQNATIAAVSTPAGKGGIGIVRISGPDALDIVGKLFQPRSPCAAVPEKKKPCGTRRLYYGQIVDPADGTPVDEVLMVVMKAPRSYTREDVVEIQAHAGPVVVRRILELVLRNGARMAEAGEFTKRAFLNGRIDLSQAEAVIDMIEARTEAAGKRAGLQLAGSLRDQVTRLREALRDALVAIEAGIDFPEEVGEAFESEALAARLEGRVLSPLKTMLSGVDHGRILREGLRLGIVGLPNVGKSSLMNRLIEEDRVIVTEIPGTTRDAVEESIDIQGIPVVLTDTAGLQKTEDPVERLGVKKSLDIIERSDMVLFVIDASLPPTQNELRIFQRMPRDRTLLVINKIDKVEPGGGCALPESWGQTPSVQISALYNRQIDALKEHVVQMALGESAQEIEYGLLPNLRHKMLLEAAAEAVFSGVRSIREGEPLELAAISIQEGIRCLGRILGIEVSEDVLDDIFERFCIGK
ncbi:MAG: tRNA uridine-5-carboxymethylaminomethyl(34) synthesis GTPase MnmE [Desulfobacterales bacterium]|jgi:tRNA modification GTPase